MKYKKELMLLNRVLSSKVLNALCGADLVALFLMIFSNSLQKNKKMASGCNPFPPSQFGTITLTGLTSGGAVSPDTNGNINLGGSNIAVVGNPATNTLRFIAPSTSGITWVYNTSPTVQMAVNTGYIDNFSGSTVYTLPVTSALGDVLYVASGLQALSGSVWQIYLNAGQQVVLGNTTTGVGPTVPGNPPTPAIIAQNDAASVYLVCSVANTRWVAISIYGNVMATPT